MTFIGLVTIIAINNVVVPLMFPYNTLDPHAWTVPVINLEVSQRPKDQLRYLKGILCEGIQGY